MSIKSVFLRIILGRGNASEVEITCVKLEFSELLPYMDIIKSVIMFEPLKIEQ